MNNNATRKNLFQLTIPIAFETLFLMLTGMIDTLMLSYVGDAAVGAVGTANTYIGIFIIACNVISAGMVAVMTQYIGSKQPGIAYQARKIGCLFNGVLGLSLSLLLCFMSDAILQLVGIAPLLMKYASIYLKIVGGSCILNAITPIFSSYLRVFGHTKQPLYATIFANISNIILNSLFLFVFDWGVTGVAIATVISRIINLLIVIILSNKLIDAQNSPERLPNKLILKQIIKIGLPSACEIALYNIAMTVTISLLNSMDPNGINVTARSYAVQITNFSYCFGAALAQANGILTGWHVGAKEFEICNKNSKKAALIGIIVAALLETLFALFAGTIMRLFSNDPEIIKLVAKLLAIDIVLEMGRVTNLVFGQALKTSGDAVFPTIIAAIFMYVCMVGGTYFFGIKLNLLVVGAYIGMACDECVRAILMFIRWETGIWKSKGLVHS